MRKTNFELLDLGYKIFDTCYDEDTKDNILENAKNKGYKDIKA